MPTIQRTKQIDTARPGRLFGAALALSLAAILAAGCQGGAIADESYDATSCSGAKLDAKGKCRDSKGRFAKATCCAAPAPICHPSLVAAVEACVQDQVSSGDFDPAYVTRWELYDQCTDAEIVAPARDQVCAVDPSQAFCALDWDAMTSQYLPGCRVEALHGWLDQACVFGDTYRDLFDRAESIVIVGRRTLTAASPLSALEQTQVLSAVEATSHDVSTVAEAFGAVDENTIFETELWDASGRRAFTAFEMGAGDSSFGKIFVQGTTTVAATINDSDLLGCTTYWGVERRRCQRDLDCRGGSKCTGSSDASTLGRCISATLDASPAEGQACTPTEAQFGCPAGSGLVCGGAANSGEGLCLPGWMRGRFNSRPNLPIPDNKPAGVTASLLAYGLATVSTDVRLHLHVSHPRIADLKVTLENPAGTSVVVFDGKPTDVAPELYLDYTPVVGFPGDESVNGLWKLSAADKKSGKTGSLYGFGLELTSRWD